MWLDIHLHHLGKGRWRAGYARAMNKTEYAHGRFWWLALWRAYCRHQEKARA